MQNDKTLIIYDYNGKTVLSVKNVGYVHTNENKFEAWTYSGSTINEKAERLLIFNSPIWTLQ